MVKEDSSGPSEGPPKKDKRGGSLGPFQTCLIRRVFNQQNQTLVRSDQILERYSPREDRNCPSVARPPYLVASWRCEKGHWKRVSAAPSPCRRSKDSPLYALFYDLTTSFSPSSHVPPPRTKSFSPPAEMAFHTPAQAKSTTHHPAPPLLARPQPPTSHSAGSKNQTLSTSITPITPIPPSAQGANASTCAVCNLPEEGHSHKVSWIGLWSLWEVEQQGVPQKIKWSPPEHPLF